MQNIKNKVFYKAFTLVELIIVITILAILATIAFVSFQGYTTNARDGQRVASLNSIEKALNIHYTKTSNYPIPDNIYLTGNLNGTLLTQVGYVGENISQLINLIGLPLDPISGTNYIYATSPNNKHYQIAATIEKPQTNNNIVKQSYAQEYTSRVVGDYRGLLKLGNVLYNLPSLIIEGDGDLSNTAFIINRGRNIAYHPYNLPITNTLDIASAFAQIGSTATMLTGITLPTTREEFLLVSGDLQSNLGYNQDVLGESIFGKSYYMKGNSSIISSGGGEIPPLAGQQWKNIDTNCDIDDIIVGTQTWAGCNSTLGNGEERGIKYDGTNGVRDACYGYSGIAISNSNCPIATPENDMYSSKKEDEWIATNTSLNASGRVHNIWGKIYTWHYSETACQDGRKLPSDNDWEILETYLNGGVNCRNLTNNWMCDELGWSGHTLKDETNNIVQALNIPMAGTLGSNGISFSHRGNFINLWSSTQMSNGTHAYYRRISVSETGTYRNANVKEAGSSVRCIKE